jgi:hypothetical protein
VPNVQYTGTTPASFTMRQGGAIVWSVEFPDANSVFVTDAQWKWIRKDPKYVEV